jgi:hypothetical protein
MKNYKDRIIDINAQTWTGYFHHYRFMYLMADIPLQKMVRIIFSVMVRIIFNVICAFNFPYTILNMTMNNIKIFIINFCIKK